MITNITFFGNLQTINRTGTELWSIKKAQLKDVDWWVRWLNKTNSSTSLLRRPSFKYWILVHFGIMLNHHKTQSWHRAIQFGLKQITLKPCQCKKMTWCNKSQLRYTITTTVQHISAGCDEPLHYISNILKKTKLYKILALVPNTGIKYNNDYPKNNPQSLSYV